MESVAQTQFVVRPVRPSEYEALGELTVIAYQGVTEMPQSEEYDRELRDVDRRARLSCVLVAVAPDGEVLGGVTYVCGPEDPFSEELRGDEAGVRMLAVRATARRQGIGAALMRECLRLAREAGKRRVVLHTGPWMPGAQRLYESLGFRRDPSVDFTPVPGIDLLAFAFDLRAS